MCVLAVGEFSEAVGKVSEGDLSEVVGNFPEIGAASWDDDIFPGIVERFSVTVGPFTLTVVFFKPVGTFRGVVGKVWMIVAPFESVKTYFEM